MGSELIVDPSKRREIVIDASGDGIAQPGETRLKSKPRAAAFKSGHYFSTMTAVAVEEGLDPTAIPALVVGYRPKKALDWLNLDTNFFRGMGYDIVVGGALNSASGSGSSSSDVSLALGAGVTFPWSDSGALSFGVMTWREEVDNGLGGFDGRTELAAYIGISLGSFNVKPQVQ